MAKQIRVMLADDHPLIRAGIRAVLTTEPDMLVVGEAVDGDETRRMCVALRPDVLLMDLNMPGPPPSQTVVYVSEHCPGTKAVALTAYSDDAYIRGLIAAGAVGYILKDEATDTVVRAVRSVIRGEQWYSPPVLAHVTAWARGDLKSTVSLTARELAVLRLIVDGKTNEAIATALGISRKTVERHITGIFRKLDVTSRTQAALLAVQNHLLESKMIEDSPEGFH